MKKIVFQTVAGFWFVFCLAACDDRSGNTKGGKAFQQASLSDMILGEEEQVYLNSSLIKFIANPDFEAVKTLAKKEKKDILIYGFGKGCPGCEVYKKLVFTSDSVADYIHSHYIPLIADLNAKPESKNPWHIKIRELMQETRMVGYPQMLILTSDGKLVNRFSGATKEPQNTIDRLEWAKEEKNQYYVRLAKFDEKATSSDELKELIQLGKNINDMEVAEKLLRIYLRAQGDIFKPDVISFMGDIISAPRDTGVQIILNNIDRVEKLENGYKAIRQALATRVATKCSYLSYMYTDESKGKATPDDVYIQQIEEAFPNYKKYAEELVMYARLRKVMKKQVSPMKEAYTIDYLNKHGKTIDYQTVMECSWDMAEHAKQEETIQDINKWTDYLLTANYINVNTIGLKAYLLKKAGKLDEAKAFVEKEIHVVTSESERAYIYKIINDKASA